MFYRLALMLLGALTFSACSHRLPAAGPSHEEIGRSSAGVQVVDVDSAIARTLAQQRRPKLLSQTLGNSRSTSNIGAGDSLEIVIWEAPPATLFGAGMVDPRSPATARATALPEQVVDHDGLITVPFAGRIRAAGQTSQQVAAEIAARLKGKANQPEAMVRISRNASATATVVGEVVNSTRVPLTAAGERLLDALAAAGGVRQPIHKMTVQITRGKQYQSLPLDLVIRDPEQNVPLHPGDVVAALFQPASFVALGATGKNEEVPLETQGITLAQALGRAGGLLDTRADPQGVFVFRFEDAQALVWPHPPSSITADGQVPVVYRINLRDPSALFVMQSFPISNKDVLYVSNAPASDLQKFLNLLFTVFYPVLSTIQLTR
jgi:polysaccharide biosynthesis/export protein